MNIFVWVWLAVLVICILIESFTMALTTIWGAIASFPLIFIALTPLSFKWQILIFVILTLVLAIFTRPLAVKKLKLGKEDKSSVGEIVGQEVLVTKSISKFQKGEVKTTNGVEWTAKCNDDSEIFENSVCKITAVEGNTLIVEKISESQN